MSSDQVYAKGIGPVLVLDMSGSGREEIIAVDRVPTQRARDRSATRIHDHPVEAVCLSARPASPPAWLVTGGYDLDVRGTCEIRRLGLDDVGLIGEIDRSEHMDTEYSVEDGMLVDRTVDLDIPTWNRDGTGEFSVAGMIEFCRPIIERGADFLGAFDGEEVLGLAVVDGSFEPNLAWCAFLYVSRRHRRRGVATALWEEAERIAVETGAGTMYVSAVPSGSAVGFYLSRGCEPAKEPHPDLFAREPEDIHLVCRIG